MEVINMLDSTLGAVLALSLASALADKETIRKTIDLLLYSARTFLQVRRKKLLGNNEASQPLEIAQQEQRPDVLAADESQALLELTSQSGEITAEEREERVIDIISRINPALDEIQLEYAERELESLLVQLRNHHRMLAIKQEQITQFAEFAPPYMKLGLKNEQRAIVENLRRIGAIMELVLNLEFPDIKGLFHMVEDGTDI